MIEITYDELMKVPYGELKKKFNDLGVGDVWANLTSEERRL